jgi:hypothetical protein
MKAKKVLIVCALTVLLVGWGMTSSVLAEERSVSEAASEDFLVGSLGTSQVATDVFHVLCGVGTTHLHADVNDNGGFDGVRLSVCVHDSGGVPAQCATSPDNGISSQVLVGGGPGAYYVTFHRSAPAGFVEAYDTIIHCHNGIHAHTGTTILLVQNQ